MQLIAFAIVGIIAIVYAGAKYARLDKLSGFGQYDVTVQMAESSGGIFKNAGSPTRAHRSGRSAT